MCGSVTLTTEVGADGATSSSRMNLSGYVGHVTIFSSMFTIACCLVVGLGLGLGLDLVSGWLIIMHTYLCDFRLSLSRTAYVQERMQGVGDEGVRTLLSS